MMEGKKRHAHRETHSTIKIGQSNTIVWCYDQEKACESHAFYGSTIEGNRLSVLFMILRTKLNDVDR